MIPDRRANVSNWRDANTARCGHVLKTGQQMRSQVPRLVAWIFCSAIGAAFADEPLRLGDCRLESALAGGSAAARCGHYTVRENRDDPHSKELQLHVAVIPAL